MEAKEILSKSQCHKILANYTQLHQNSFEIKSFHATPLQSQLDGLIGEQYILKIQYLEKNDLQEAQFFVKTLSEAIPVMRQLSKEIQVYEKEAFFYDTLVPLLKQRGLKCDYAPKSFLCQPVTVVLENLANLGYQGSGKNVSLDYRHCEMCIRTLADFHLEPTLYEISKTKELGKTYKLIDEFRILERKVFSQDDNAGNRFVQCSVDGLSEIIDLIPQNGVSAKTFMETLRRVVNEQLSFLNSQEGYRSTILHGDLWSNNFLYLYGTNNEIKDCKLVDFQTLNYGPPARDVLQFILTNTRRKFREEHQKELLTYYYNYLCQRLSERGTEPSEVFSEGEFWRSCDIFLLPAKLQAVVDRSITFISEERFMQAAQSDESFSKFLFEDRGKYIREEFLENSVFREVLTEDICELREILFSKELM